MQELWPMWSILSFPLLPGSLWLGVVVPDWVLSVDKIELFDIWTKFKQMTYAKLKG